MSEKLQRNMDTLRLLTKAKPAARKAILKTGDKSLVNALCECSLNVLKGNIPLTTHQKNRLRGYKTTLRALAAKSTPLKKRRTLLQRGGFLGALLPPVLGVLGSILN